MKNIVYLVTLCSCVNVHAQYTNLVLEGGGMKGLAYAGVFEVLDSIGITNQITHVAGSSSGAMNGLMYAIGYSGKEVRKINLNTNFNKYNQVGFPLFGGLVRLKKLYGYYKTDRLIKDLGALMEAKGYSKNMTFSDLHDAQQAGKKVKLLYVTGANLTDQRIELFCHNTYPSMKILDAVRISISIPMYFEAVFMKPDGSLVKKKDADASTRVMVDGGILDNYPFYIFDTLVTVNNGSNFYYKCNPKTLGIKLESDSSAVYIAPKSIPKIRDYVMAFGLLSSEYLNRRHLGSQQKAQTIFVNTHQFNPKIKRQKRVAKLKIMGYGSSATLHFFKQ